EGGKAPARCPHCVRGVKSNRKPFTAAFAFPVNEVEGGRGGEIADRRRHAPRRRLFSSLLALPRHIFSSSTGAPQYWCATPTDLGGAKCRDRIVRSSPRTPGAPRTPCFGVESNLLWSRNRARHRVDRMGCDRCWGNQMRGPTHSARLVVELKYRLNRP